MTDQEIIQGLINRDAHITQDFFFVRCRPLIISIIKYVFSYPVDYDEFVNELYIYLVDSDSKKLREFQFKSSLFVWIKVVAIRYFIRKRDHVIDINNGMPPYNKTIKDGDTVDTEASINARMDLEQLFLSMKNERYVFVIRKLILEDVQPEFLAKNMGVTVANLYNIKKRAISALTKVALKEKNYGKV
ncbi:MAG: sigma-70 family RNA polymerase sigma factor [Prevotella sp.]|nr:sigma-70 family RNA polymerase sigma factor [Prevotella sp.]